MDVSYHRNKDSMSLIDNYRSAWSIPCLPWMFPLFPVPLDVTRTVLHKHQSSIK